MITGETELHIHLEGSVTPECLHTLLNRSGKFSFPTSKIRKRYNECRNFQDFIEIYKLIIDSIKNEEDIRYIFHQLGKYFQNENIGYAEILISPSLLCDNIFSYKSYFSLMDDCAHTLKKDYNVDVCYIIDGVRQWGAGPLNEILVHLEKSSYKCIRAISLGGIETGVPAGEFKKTFEHAKEMGLHRYCHLGEFGDEEWIWENLKTLRPERIAHGINTANSPALLEYLMKEKIGVDQTITGNMILGAVSNYESHPLKKMLTSGVIVTLSTDDPGIFMTGLDNEYKIAEKYLGLDDSDINQLKKNAQRVTNHV